MEYIKINNSDSVKIKTKISIIKKMFHNNNYIKLYFNDNFIFRFIRKLILIHFNLFLIFYYRIINQDDINLNLFNHHYINSVKPNYFSLLNHFDDINKKNILYLNITSINYSLDVNNNIIKVEYSIGFYDKNSKLIIPSDLTLYNSIHVLCVIKEKNNENIIISLANIIHNKYYQCNEFYNINDKNIFGIRIYKIDKKTEHKNVYFFSYNKYYIYRYMKKFKNNFDCLTINKEYQLLINKTKYNINNIKLKELYILKPICISKKNFNFNNNEWHFINIYNYYFCLCKGVFCLYKNISQKCKYYFYLFIIDNNKYIYNKTDYLFGDFIYKKYSSDDVYPIFEEMINQKLPAHYLTQDADIYKKHCKINNENLTIIPVTNDNDIIDGDFLEKYLTIFLKLKAAITGAEFFFINNLFYNIDYITYINVGHGISFFKHFLYANNSYYGFLKYNKILIPPSIKLINIAKQYGWIEDNIIKINLPRWDKYIDENNYLFEKGKNNNSIFIMFTWRHLQKDKNISIDYFKNILNLINNNRLIKTVKMKNISIYFSLHHKVYEYKSKLKISKYIKYIEENQISDILSKVNLIVTDFSSIIFDLIYRKKPFIIFIPDSNYSNIKDNYHENYYMLIKEMKEGKIYFKNKFFNVNKVIKKIIYYINNNFQLEKSLEKFYNSFCFKKENSTQKFIEYLTNLNI